MPRTIPQSYHNQDWDDWSDQDEDDDWAPEKHGDNDWADQSWAPWRVRCFPGEWGKPGGMV